MSYGFTVERVAIVAVGGTDVDVFGLLVKVGSTVAVNGKGVNVSGSVGTPVGEPNCGMNVMPGVIVGTFGTNNCKPTGMLFGSLMQFARCMSAVVVPYCSAIRYR